MNVATVRASCVVGVDALPVLVEAQIGRGLPGLELVGIPDRGGRESAIRVKAALASLGIALPPRHLVVNLAPSDLRKAGASFDLAIALALLAAAEAIAGEALRDTLVLGELALSGELRPVSGVLAQLRAAASLGVVRAIVPLANAAEAALAPSIDARVAGHLADVVAYVQGEGRLARAMPTEDSAPDTHGEDLGDVRGQGFARRALEIAATGRHALMFVGPPGSGKTMLARRLRTILPPPDVHEAMEIATIAGTAGAHLPRSLAAVARPFRAPHHTASAASIVGGGDPVRPGEVTLAHGGVLFLDELPEFRRDVVESLRVTMEHGIAVVTRTRGRVSMPAAPLIVAAMNPCPCGYAGDSRRLCACPPDRVARYAGRVSGPVLDRFDLYVRVPRVDPRKLRGAETSETSASVRERVMTARARLDADGPRTPIAIARSLDANATRLLDSASDKLGLSARGHAKVLRVARTIAALEGVSEVETSHLAEALGYRGPSGTDVRETTAETVSVANTCGGSDG